MTLYEIETIYLGLLQQAEENEGDITDILAEWESINAAFEVKAENYWRMIKNFRAQAEMFKAEKDKLYEKQKRAERLADGLLERMDNAMKLIDIPVVKTKYGSFSFRKSTSVTILDETAIPDEFMKITKAPQKSVISDAIKAGEIVPGAELTENKKLQVR